jgi:predicted nucleic acid-binding Zn ribbon protein
LDRLRASGPRRRRRRPAAERGAERDPVLLGDEFEALVERGGWTRERAVAGVTGRWAEILGDQLARHCAAESFDEATGRLVIRAESEAWASALRLQAATVLRNFAAAVGDGVVTDVTVLGPAGRPKKPGWRVRPSKPS